MKLNSVKFGLHEVIRADAFSDLPPALVMVPIHADSVLVVQPKLESPDSWWSLPQSKIRRGGITLIELAFLKLNKELGFPVREIDEFGISLLGSTSEKLTCGSRQNFFFLGIPVRSGGLSTVKSPELTGSQWVSGPTIVNQILSGLAKSRPRKYRTTKAAIEAAHRKGLLSWAIN